MGLKVKSKSYPIHTKTKLSEIRKTHSLRCDAKQFEKKYSALKKMIDTEDTFYLGELIPQPLVKGGQPSYIDGTDGIPVINTLSIHHLQINLEDCRYISEEDFECIIDNRKLKKGDVLLTMDGGTSIGKSTVFDLDGNYTVDSHVAIIRPIGISAKAMAYLLASPMGQLQFKKAESGASGQTAVTEEDLRRFQFPRALLKNIEGLAEDLDKKREKINEKRKALEKEELEAWKAFSNACLNKI